MLVLDRTTDLPFLAYCVPWLWQEHCLWLVLYLQLYIQGRNVRKWWWSSRIRTYCIAINFACNLTCYKIDNITKESNKSTFWNSIFCFCNTFKYNSVESSSKRPVKFSSWIPFSSLFFLIEIIVKSQIAI